jgi:hypothetical protein
MTGGIIDLQSEIAAETDNCNTVLLIEKARLL